MKSPYRLELVSCIDTRLCVAYIYPSYHLWTSPSTFVRHYYTVFGTHFRNTYHLNSFVVIRAFIVHTDYLIDCVSAFVQKPNKLSLSIWDFYLNLCSFLRHSDDFYIPRWSSNSNSPVSWVVLCFLFHWFLIVSFHLCKIIANPGISILSSFFVVL